jgi:hypothetical protein
LENKTVPVPNCLSGTARQILDRSNGAFEPQAGLLGSAIALIFLYSFSILTAVFRAKNGNRRTNLNSDETPANTGRINACQR